MRLDTIPFPIIFICEDWCQSAARLLPGASCVAAVQGSGGFEKLLTQSNLEQETSDQSDPASVEADGCQLTLVCSLQSAVRTCDVGEAAVAALPHAGPEPAPGHPQAYGYGYGIYGYI